MMPGFEELADAMAAYFGDDSRRIAHARKVTGYAEKLLAEEPGDPNIVVPAALLHDIGIHAAEQKHGSSAGKFQEIEGPPVARAILARLAVPPARIDEICEIIAHHHSPGVVNTLNFRILYDADWLVNLGDETDTGDKARLGGVIDKLFLTPTGKKLARRVYLPAD
ncbi:MAG: HD domain-containing protein [Chloroflexi bacterium]|nr:HD domain-containing protein [Chloroflexota bacterium]